MRASPNSFAATASPCAASPCAAVDADSSLDELRAEISGKNVNETSFLATDYLNHFGEVIMLLELLPDMPDCFEELASWQPKSYAQHFRDSGFQHADLIIRAYESAPPMFRESFDRTIAHMDSVTLEAMARIEAILAEDQTAQLAPLVEAATSRLTRLNDLAAGIINGQNTTADQDMIDDIMGS